MTARPPIRFRGRSFLAMVLAPVPPVDQWLAELDALKQRAPAFFSVRAIILDVTGLSFDRSDLLDLCAELNKRSITILGIEGIGPTSLGPASRRRWWAASRSTIFRRPSPAPRRSPPRHRPPRKVRPRPRRPRQGRAPSCSTRRCARGR